MPERLDDFWSRKRAKTRDMERPYFDSFFFSQVPRRSRGRFHKTPHTDDDVLGAVECVTIGHSIAASRQRVKFLCDTAHDRGNAIIKISLRDLALHVTILVLHHSTHDRMSRIHKIA